MSDFTLKPGQGSLFHNRDKKTDSHPDITGTLVQPDGQELWMSIWKKRSKNGNEWFSVSVRAKDSKTETQEPISERAKAREPAWATKAKREPIDDDIPFNYGQRRA